MLGVKIETRAQPGAAIESRTLSLFLVYAFWVLMVFELDWFLSATVGGPFYRIPTLLAPVLALITLSRGNRRAIYWPLILFVLLHLAASLFAENRGLSLDALKFMLYMVLLFATSVSVLDSPTKVIVVLKLYLLGFVWFGLQGLPSGLVWWHPLMGNEDSYGPLMVISMAFSYFFALATSSVRWRWVARGVFLMSVMGVVTSFARGAALSAMLVAFYLLLRSPHKAKALTILVLATIVALPLVGFFVSMDAYIGEISTSLDSGDVRMTLWKLVWDVFKESPIYGVGALNFGVIASQITPFDLTRRVASDPAQLYFWTVHNAHLQILAEEGLIGITLWAAMIVAFFRGARKLSTSDARAHWERRGGQDFDFLMIARALEGAMVGYLATSLFYNQLYIHWFWSLLTISYVLVSLTHRRARAPQGWACSSRG